MKIRRPLLGVAIFFIGGTWCGLTLTVPAIHVFIAAWIFVLLSLLIIRVRASRYVSGREERAGSGLLGMTPILLTVFFTAWTAAGVRIEDLKGCALRAPGLQPSTQVEVMGLITDDPSVSEGKATVSNGVVWQFTLASETVRMTTGGPEKPACSPIIVRLRSWADRSPPHYGDRWRISGKIRNGRPEARIFRQRFFLNSNSRDAVCLSAGHGTSFMGWCYDQRRAAAEFLSAGITDFPNHVGLLRALILGYRQDLPLDVKNDFAWTGTLHIIAISGSHIVVVAGILIFVLQAFGISRVHWGLFLAPLLIIYTAAIGLPSSAVRATVMAIVYFIAPLLHRKADIVSSLAMAALLILAVAPGQLFDVGFILSFVCVLGLIVLCPLIDRPLLKMLEPDPLRLQPEAGRVTALRVVGRYMVSLLALAVSGWLISTPLSAYYFGRFSIVALPANMVIVPLAFFILLSGCLSLVLGPCVLLLADIFNHANVVLVSIMLGTMKFMADIPHGNFQSQWPLSAVLVWYAVLGSVALWLHSRRAAPAKVTERAVP